MPWSDNNVTNCQNNVTDTIFHCHNCRKSSVKASPSEASSVCLCVIIQRFVTCIVNRGSASEGRVPATGNDADQNPRFYAPSPLITYWAATEQPPLVISNHGAQTTKILAKKTRPIGPQSWVVLCAAVHFKGCSELLKVVFTAKKHLLRAKLFINYCFKINSLELLF